MDDEAFKPGKDEEYQFSETGDNAGAFASTTSATNKPNILEQIKRKNLIIALVVIGIVLGVYKLVSIFSSPSTTDSARKIAPAVSVATAPQVISNVPPSVSKTEVAPTAPVVAAPPSPAPISAELNTRLNTIEERDTALQASVDKLSSQVAELQATLSNLETRLSGLNDTVQDVAGKQAQMLAKAAEKRRKAFRSHATPKPIYFVRAIVAGRAWLSTRNGGTVTVGVGHNLPGYGIVEAIDPNQGTVTTNTGAIIGYSPEDN